MSKEEIIQKLKMLKSEIEWDLSLEYQIVLDNVIKILKGLDDG